MHTGTWTVFSRDVASRGFSEVVTEVRPGSMMPLLRGQQGWRVPRRVGRREQGPSPPHLRPLNWGRTRSRPGGRAHGWSSSPTPALGSHPPQERTAPDPPDCGGRLRGGVVKEAAISAMIIMITFRSSQAGLPIERFLEALIGGGTPCLSTSYSRSTPSAWSRMSRT